MFVICICPLLVVCVCKKSTGSGLKIDFFLGLRNDCDCKSFLGLIGTHV